MITRGGRGTGWSRRCFCTDRPCTLLELLQPVAARAAAEQAYGPARLLLIYLLGIGGNVAGLWFGDPRSLGQRLGRRLRIMGAIGAYAQVNRRVLGGGEAMMRSGSSSSSTLHRLGPRSGIDNLGHVGGSSPARSSARRRARSTSAPARCSAVDGGRPARAPWPRRRRAVGRRHAAAPVGLVDFPGRCPEAPRPAGTPFARMRRSARVHGVAVRPRSLRAVENAVVLPVMRTSPSSPRAAAIGDRLHARGVGGATPASSASQPRPCSGRQAGRGGVVRTDDEWLSVDLGAEYEIARIDVIWETAHASAYDLGLSGVGSLTRPWSTR